MSEDGKTKLFGNGDIRIQVGDNFSITEDGKITAKSGQIGSLTISDIDALGGDITTNSAILSVEGLTTVKRGEAVDANFVVSCYRGNILFTDIEYLDYDVLLW